jgi:hypothetical protein
MALNLGDPRSIDLVPGTRAGAVPTAPWGFACVPSCLTRMSKGLGLMHSPTAEDSVEILRVLHPSVDWMPGKRQ